MSDDKEQHFFTRANEHALQDRGGVRFQWQETPVEWGNDEYANIYAALYANGDFQDGTLPNSFPILVLKDLLILSEMQLIDLLNEPSSSKRHIVTRLEESFREYEKTKKPDDMPFFYASDLNYVYTNLIYFREGLVKDRQHGDRGLACDYCINILDFEEWARNNPDMLPENRYKTTQDDPAELHKKIDELQDKLAKRDQRIKELEKAAQDGAEGAGADKLDGRIKKSVYKICAAILTMCGKSLNSSTRNAIKRQLDELNLSLSENTAKDHFDVIQEIMEKKPQ